MIREGDIRRDLEILQPLKDQIDFRRLILVTDGTNPELLVERGYLVDVVQKALDLGIPLVDAVRMVTLNAAEHFGLERELGGLAPGRQADVLLLPAEDRARPDMVIARGEVVVWDGRLIQDILRKPMPDQLYRTVRLDPVTAQDLAVPAPINEGELEVRTMEVQPGGLVTREGRATARVREGRCLADPEHDLLKVAFWERATGRGDKFVGFVRGWGLSKGALASSVTWDALGVAAVGADDDDLAAAVNRVIELQGASVACHQGGVLEEISFGAAGYVSDLPVEQVARRMRSFQRKAESLGCGLPYAHLTLNITSATAIPFIRMTEEGYYRFRQGDIKGLESPGDD
jgi:adenine deaminase